jgi:hypothetical protein
MAVWLEIVPIGVYIILQYLLVDEALINGSITPSYSKAQNSAFQYVTFDFYMMHVGWQFGLRLCRLGCRHSIAVFVGLI